MPRRRWNGQAAERVAAISLRFVAPNVPSRTGALDS
jgi:hypothetical protein